MLGTNVFGWSADAASSCQILDAFVDAAFARHCTRNPLRRGQLEGRDYQRLTVEEYLHA